ncbi:unnamed protein product [Amoebophrya sp. A120]|nr:unnamed protein product [Amoebophrya sp. A120]|eukprot:GSA120T00009456001.1
MKMRELHRARGPRGSVLAVSLLLFTSAAVGTKLRLQLHRAEVPQPHPHPPRDVESVKISPAHQALNGYLAPATEQVVDLQPSAPPISALERDEDPVGLQQRDDFFLQPETEESRRGEQEHLVQQVPQSYGDSGNYVGSPGAYVDPPYNPLESTSCPAQPAVAPSRVVPATPAGTLAQQVNSPLGTMQARSSSSHQQNNDPQSNDPQEHPDYSLNEQQLIQALTSFFQGELDPISLAEQITRVADYDGGISATMLAMQVVGSSSGAGLFANSVEVGSTSNSASKTSAVSAAPGRTIWDAVLELDQQTEEETANAGVVPSSSRADETQQHQQQVHPVSVSVGMPYRNYENAGNCGRVVEATSFQASPVAAMPTTAQSSGGSRGHKHLSCREKREQRREMKSCIHRGTHYESGIGSKSPGAQGTTGKKSVAAPPQTAVTSFLLPVEEDVDIQYTPAYLPPPLANTSAQPSLAQAYGVAATAPAFGVTSQQLSLLQHDYSTAKSGSLRWARLMSELGQTPLHVRTVFDILDKTSTGSSSNLAASTHHSYFDLENSLRTLKKCANFERDASLSYRVKKLFDVNGSSACSAGGNSSSSPSGNQLQMHTNGLFLTTDAGKTDRRCGGRARAGLCRTRTSREQDHSAASQDDRLLPTTKPVVVEMSLFREKEGVGEQQLLFSSVATSSPSSSGSSTSASTSASSVASSWSRGSGSFSSRTSSSSNRGSTSSSFSAAAGNYIPTRIVHSQSANPAIVRNSFAGRIVLLQKDDFVKFSATPRLHGTSGFADSALHGGNPYPFLFNPEARIEQDQKCFLFKKWWKKWRQRQQRGSGRHCGNLLGESDREELAEERRRSAGRVEEHDMQRTNCAGATTASTSTASASTIFASTVTAASSATGTTTTGVGQAASFVSGHNPPSHEQLRESASTHVEMVPYEFNRLSELHLQIGTGMSATHWKFTRRVRMQSSRPVVTGNYNPGSSTSGFSRGADAAFGPDDCI